MRGYAQIAERLRRSSVQVTDGRGGGAGVIWDQRGLVVTNAHVAHGPRVTIVDCSGNRAEGRLTKCDRERDLALIDVAAHCPKLPKSAIRIPSARARS
jgi:S1-C subfamily serine protease